MLADDSRYMRDAILGRMIQASYGMADTQVAALGVDDGVMVTSLDDQAMGLGPRDSYTPPPPAPAPNLAFWTRGFGTWANFDGNANAANASRNAISLSRTTSRFPLQADARMICANFLFRPPNLIVSQRRPVGPQMSPSGIIGSRHGIKFLAATLDRVLRSCTIGRREMDAR